jgi:hypothetical protein
VIGQARAQSAGRDPDWIVGTAKGEWVEAWNRLGTVSWEDRRAYRKAQYAYTAICNQRREAWMRLAGVQDCTARRCLGKVVLGNGHKSCYTRRGDCVYQKCMQRFYLEIFDHAAIFFHPKSRTYVLTSQPYNLTCQHFDMLHQWCCERGLVADVLPAAGWHCPTAPLVVVRRKEARAGGGG